MAQADIERGYKKSEHSHPVCNYKFRILKARLLRSQGRCEEASHLLDADPPHEIVVGEFAVRRKIAQSLAFECRGLIPKAQQSLREAKSLADATAPGSLDEVAWNEGQFAFDQKDFALAEQHWRRAAILAKTNHNQYVEAEAKGSLGRLMTQRQSYDAAIDLLTESLELARSQDAPMIEAPASINLGWSYLELGDYERAVPLFRQAEKLSGELGLKQAQEDALTNLGRIYFNQANYHEASAYYLDALRIAEKLNNNSSRATCLDNLALVELGLGNLDKARNYNENALVIKRADNDYGQELKSLLTKAEIAFAANPHDGTIERLLSQIIHDTDQKSLRWEAEAQLAELYAAQNQTARAERQFKRALETLDNARSTLLHDEYRLSFSTESAEFYGNYIRFLVERGQSTKALQFVEFVRARTLAEGLNGANKPSGFMGLRASAAQRSFRKRNQVVLSYWLASDKSFLWAITPDEIRFFPLPAKAVIDKKVEEYERCLLGPNDAKASEMRGQELYELLVKPAEPLIARAGRVIIIPDGSLNKFNFETLIVPGPSPHYWIEDVVIENASSISLLASSKGHQEDAPKKLFMIGNPDQANSEYQTLAHANEEMQLVAGHFRPDERVVVPGRYATPSAYSMNHPERFSHIHFVTHGIASDLDPLDSAIILSRDKNNNDLYKLYAREILKTPLRAELVTISACYGAGARTYSGEGMVGLAWAFLRAGAHQVIAGLWQVDDGFAPDFMNDFYGELEKGKDAADALRAAKLKRLKSGTIYRRPVYWASLQLYTGA